MSNQQNNLPEFTFWLFFLALVFAWSFVMESDFQRIESKVRQFCIEVEQGNRVDNLNKYNQWCKGEA